jgi:hypothetical protein
MRGIYGRPWLNLDSLLPLDLLDIEEIEVGLAQVERQPNVFGTHNPRDFTRVQNAPAVASERVQKLYSTASHTNLQFYAKAAFGTYSPSVSVKLSVPRGAYHPTMMDDVTQWTTRYHDIFPSVYQFLRESNAFAGLGRLNVFIQEHYCHIPVHVDYPHELSNPHTGYQAPVEKEFLWINPRQIKGLYVLDDVSGERHNITSRSAWFNPLDLHGGDAVDRLTWTFRFDGVFTPWFRKQIEDLYSDGRPR